MYTVPIIIPAYEPDERLPGLLKELKEKGFHNIILVDDGSGERFRKIFEEAEEIISDLGGTILTHDVNRGKGRALKTAFAYVLREIPNATGVVTADSDGQHTADCIRLVMKRVKEQPDAFILGVRSFDGDEVPWKSRFGNKLTRRVLGYVAGIRISDTQTGLRGIPRAFMRELLDVPGDRFEFETKMLLEAAGRYTIEEVTIKTVYDSKENHQTHFNPVKDSIRIYRALCGQLLLYLFSSLSSFVIDIGLFVFFCDYLKGKLCFYTAVSTILARIISASWNYTVNYRIVFRSREKIGASAVRYAALALIQMLLSAFLVTGGTMLLPMLPEVMAKIVIDMFLFLVSYYIQQKYVF